jgi:hypothetical protein
MPLAPAAAELAQSAQRSADVQEATLDGLLNKLGLMHLRALLAAEDILDVSRSLSCVCLRQCVCERERERERETERERERERSSRLSLCHITIIVCPGP